jgi:hypothetical protein
MMAAGISDWGMLVATGEGGTLEAELSGSCGWEGAGPHPHDQVSPISFASKIRTPVLTSGRPALPPSPGTHGLDPWPRLRTTHLETTPDSNPPDKLLIDGADFRTRSSSSASRLRRTSRTGNGLTTGPTSTGL